MNDFKEKFKKNNSYLYPTFRSLRFGMFGIGIAPLGLISTYSSLLGNFACLLALRGAVPPPDEAGLITA